MFELVRVPGSGAILWAKWRVEAQHGVRATSCAIAAAVVVGAVVGVPLAAVAATAPTTVSSDRNQIEPAPADETGSDADPQGSSATTGADGRKASFGSRPGYALNVDSTGFQAEINACHGATNIGPTYGVPVIAQHWSCGGSRFPTMPGMHVSLRGVITGDYTIEGIVATLNASRDTPADIPRGHDLLYQICRGGNSSTTIFVGLKRMPTEEPADPESTQAMTAKFASTHPTPSPFRPSMS